MKILKVLIAVLMLVGMVMECFAGGRRLLGEGTYEYQRRDGSTYKIYVGEYSKVLEPLQNSVIQTQGTMPCNDVTIIIIESKGNRRKHKGWYKND